MNNKIFVGNISYLCSVDEFKEFASCLPGYVKADVTKKYNSDNSCGYGYIEFETENFANSVLENNKEYLLSGRKLRFLRYKSNHKSRDSYIINDTDDIHRRNFVYVKNVPINFTPNDVKQIFLKYSDVGICYTNSNIYTGESKGTAVVEILNSDVFYDLLNKQYIVTTDEITLSITKWKQQIKSKNMNNA